MSEPAIACHVATHFLGNFRNLPALSLCLRWQRRTAKDSFAQHPLLVALSASHILQMSNHRFFRAGCISLVCQSWWEAETFSPPQFSTFPSCFFWKLCTWKLQEASLRLPRLLKILWTVVLTCFSKRGVVTCCVKVSTFFVQLQPRVTWARWKAFEATAQVSAPGERRRIFIGCAGLLSRQCTVGTVRNDEIQRHDVLTHVILCQRCVKTTLLRHDVDSSRPFDRNKPYYNTYFHSQRYKPSGIYSIRCRWKV